MKNIKKSLLSNLLFITINVIFFSCFSYAVSLDKQLSNIRSSDAVLRQEAIESLGALSKKGDIAKLLEATKKESSKSVQAVLIQAIGKTKSKDAVSTLLLFIKDDDFFVRLNSIWALGEIGDGAAVTLLNEQLKLEANEVVITEIVKSLGKLKAGRESAELIYPLLGGKNKILVQTVMETLAILKDESGIEFLINAFKNEGYSKTMRVQCLRTAKEKAGPKSIENVVKTALEGGFTKIGWNESDAEVLKKYLDNGDDKIRIATYGILCKINFEKNWEHTKKGLADNNVKVRQIVIQEAKSADFKEIVNELMPIFSKQDEDTKDIIVDVYRRFESVEGLKQCLTDASTTIKTQVSLYLARLGDNSGASTVFEGLKSNDSRVFEMALDAAETMKDEKAMPLLKEAAKRIKDKQLKVRIKEVIENIGKK